MADETNEKETDKTLRPEGKSSIQALKEDIEALKGLERKQDETKAMEIQEKPPIVLSRSQKKLWLSHDSEIRAMEDVAASQIRQLGNTIRVNLIEQFAQELGVDIGVGKYRFDGQSLQFIVWPEPPKVKMPKSEIPSGAGDKP